jgi:outer membrane protein
VKVLLTFLIFTGHLATAAPAPLSLADAIKRGLEFSPEVQKAQSEYKYARAAHRQAISSLFPTIDLTASSGKTVAAEYYGGATTDLNRARLEGEQPLFTGGVISAALRATTAKKEAAEKRLKLANHLYTFKIVSTYYTTAQAQTLLEIAKENREILKTYLSITTRYAKIGRSKAVDRLQAEASYNLSESDVMEAESALESLRQDLIRLIGDESGTNATLVPKLRTEKFEIGTLDKIYDQALSSNPEIQAVELDLKSLIQQNRAKMINHRPKLSLKGFWGYDSPEEKNWFHEKGENYGVSLNLKVPLFSGGSSFAESDQYAEQRVQLEKDLAVKRLELRKSVASSLITMQKDFQRLKLTQSSADSSKKAMDVALRDYRNGLLNATEVLTIQRGRFEADRKNTLAQYSYNQQILNLRYDLGLDIEQTYGDKK